jgi:hypothetical protein
MCAAAYARGPIDARGLWAVISERSVDDGIGPDAQVTACHLNVAAYVRVDTRAAGTHLKILTHPPVDSDFPTADGQTALHVRFRPDVYMTAGHARATSDLPFEAYMPARGIHAAIDVGAEIHLATGRHFIAMHRSRG